MHQAASLFHEGFGWISNGTEPNRKHCVGKCLLHVQNRWWTEFPEQSWLSDDVPVASDDHQHTLKKEHKITWLITQDSNETNTATIWSSVFILWSSYFPPANAEKKILFAIIYILHPKEVVSTLSFLDVLRSSFHWICLFFLSLFFLSFLEEILTLQL